VSATAGRPTFPGAPAARRAARGAAPRAREPRTLTEDPRASGFKIGPLDWYVFFEWIKIFVTT
jgi:hypothetical protein